MEIYNLCLDNKYSTAKIAQMYNVSQGTVNGIKLKKTWKHIHEQ
jgi:DNA-binding CsgD family transcriptional regulator